MAKVRVEVDLLKPLLKSVWVGLEDDNFPLRGFEQKIEWESVPKYCKHCKKIGHAIINCWVLEKKIQMEKKEKEKEAGESSNIIGGENNSKEMENDEEDGSWQVQKNKKNRQRRQDQNKGNREDGGKQLNEELAENKSKEKVMEAESHNENDGEKEQAMNNN